LSPKQSTFAEKSKLKNLSVEIENLNFTKVFDEVQSIMKEICKKTMIKKFFDFFK
jgi:hypothetical protein